PITTIERGDSNITGFSFRTTLSGVYRSCRVEYSDPKTKNTIKHEFTPPNPPKTSRVLVINERVASYDEASRLAKKRLRQENKNETTITISLLGDIRFVAGLTVNVKGYQSLDGKYIITRATHGQQKGYTTKIEL